MSTVNINVENGGRDVTECPVFYYFLEAFVPFELNRSHTLEGDEAFASTKYLSKGRIELQFYNKPECCRQVVLSTINYFNYFFKTLKEKLSRLLYYFCSN